jgi:RHS repeat-associated protein
MCSHALLNASRCTGKERDSESGLDYFGARYYTSSMGRWMSPDWSAKVEPVPYSKLYDPQTLNLYGYLTNSPLSRTDPDGHGPLWDKFVATFYGKASAGPGVGAELKATKYAKVEIGAKAQLEVRGSSSGVDVTGKAVAEATVTVGKTSAGASVEADKQLVKNGNVDPQPTTVTGNVGINAATAGPNEIGVEGHIGALGVEAGVDVDKAMEFGQAVKDSVNALGQNILNAVTPNPNASPSAPGAPSGNPFNIPLPTPPKQ